MPVNARMRIMPMTMDHLAAVMAVERESFSQPWSRDAFKFELIHNEIARYLVAVVQGTVVGYAGMWVLVDEAHVTNIAVLPEWRRQGIAKALLSRLIEIAIAGGADKMTLEVRKSNWGARQLYQDFGFQALGFRRNYYSETREDAIVMWKFDLDQR
ncbi:MAG TPA: ribosomal protein S18-alanine N-acetyltransferase [bacterium]|nr:ribosomal protein S18-alanine N-acetyltransferase [bacterium]